MRHIGQKLLALTLALLLWYMVNDTRLGNKLISRVPLQFDTEHLPGNMYHEISGQPYASFTIRGPQEDIRVVDSGNFVVSVPLRGVNVGENTISLTRDTVSAKDIQEHLKHRIVVLPGSMVPERVIVQILYHKKEVPVKVVTSGEPAQGYMLVEKRLHPEKVWITGAPEAMENVVAVNTKTLDVTNIDSSMKVNVILDYVGLPVHALSDSDQQVEVEFIVREK